WKASDATVRNRKPPSSRSVITGEVEAGEIIGILFGLATLVATGIVTPLDNAPTNTFAPLILASLLAAETPACGSVWASPTFSFTDWPSTPPAALISSTASLIPLRLVSP